EKLAEVDPELIIISGRQADLYDQLTEIAPTIYLGVDETDYMNSFENNVDIIGEIFNKEEEAQTELDAIEEQVDATAEKAEEADKSGLIVLANDDKISAYGPSSRFGLIHDVFGVKPVDEDIEASTHGMNVSFEYVTEQDPDLLYVIDRGAAIGEESAAEIDVENKKFIILTSYFLFVHTSYKFNCKSLNIMIISAIRSMLSFVFLKNIIYVKGGSNMNAVLVAILGLVIFALGYRFYSKFIAERI